MSHNTEDLQMTDSIAHKLPCLTSLRVADDRFNPFIGPACKISRLKYLQTCTYLQTVYFQVLQQNYFQTVCFDEVFSHANVKNKARGIMISNLAFLLVIFR